MKALFQAIYDSLLCGQDLVLCSIIASSGSTPRGESAKMAVFTDGSTTGTIGGGALEYHCICRAKEALKEKRAFTAGFNLAPDQTADIGMICGGQVTVYFQYFSCKDMQVAELFHYIVSLFSRNMDTWLVTRIADGGACQIGVYEENRGLLYTDDIPPEIITPMLKSKSVLYSGEFSFHVEPLTRAGFVYVFGGGHVSQELVPVIVHVGFRPVLYEDRKEFASAELFPQAESIIEAPFTEIEKHIHITGKDYVVILTRGHQKDFEVPEQALRSNACYVGIIGSRQKIELTNQKLLEAGIPREELKRIHTPIGLPIKGETPAEIAISIAAELILHRAEFIEKPG